MKIETGYKYKGYTYLEIIEVDGDKQRRYHYSIDSESNKTELDYSMYVVMTEEAFKTLVDFNFPDRQDSSVPWNFERLEDYKDKQNYTIYNKNLTDL